MLLVFVILGAARLLRGARSDVVHQSTRGENAEIYLLDFNRGIEKNLTHNSAWDAAPARSFDGQMVAFASLRDGNQEIYVMDVEGSHVRRLTDNPARDTHPAWSPDGSHITFASDRSGNWDIFSMSADGRDGRQLTNHPLGDDEPVWSPDGSQIAFVSYRYKNSAIYLMNPDGSAVQMISDPRFRNIEPAWSPDGTRLIVTSDPYTHNFELYELSRDGNATIRLTTDPAWDAGAIWVDDQHLIFHSTRDDKTNPELYIMDHNGHDVRRLTYNHFRDGDPS